MKLQSITTLVIAILISVPTHGQLFRPLNINTGTGEQIAACPYSRMHIEDNTLYVCTNQGLYSKDLSEDDSNWGLSGIEGVPLLDYVRKGSDILALRYNANGGFLLLSHDGGKTYEDVTPESFTRHFDGPNVLISLVQNPGNPNGLLVSSYYMGILQSSDFGQTWNQLTDWMVGPFIGFHPLRSDIIYNNGEDDMMSPSINVSYDSGQTWKYIYPSFPGDNYVYRIAFHPTSPDKWIVGGQGVVYTTNDNAQTWETQNYWDDVQGEASWMFAAYDCEDNDMVYMAGYSDGSEGAVKLMYSTDGGKSWSIPQSGPAQDKVYDLQQYGDKLLIYTQTDIYEISKAELVAQSSISHVTSVATDSKEPSVIYDLQGRRVGRMDKGIYIKDGKKIIR